MEKVNLFYLLKEDEVFCLSTVNKNYANQFQLKVRLVSLLEQKRSMQAQERPVSKFSSRYIALEEGFRQFSRDLTKLQVRQSVIPFYIVNIDFTSAIHRGQCYCLLENPKEGILSRLLSIVSEC